MQGEKNRDGVREFSWESDRKLKLACEDKKEPTFLPKLKISWMETLPV